MTLTELRYLVTLADLGHFGKAAEACHVSQPTLSIALKKLEENLGVILIERSKTRIVPTSTGEAIIKQAKEVLRQASLIKDIAQSGKKSLNSPLKIGAIFTIGPYLFPHLLPQLKKTAPDMPLIIEENYTRILRSKLVDTSLDAIIIALPFNEKDTVCKPLYEEPFVVMLPSKHPLSQVESIDPSALLKESVLLLGEGHCLRDQILTALPELKQHIMSDKLSIAASANTSLDTLKHMVASGLGITILPISATGLTQQLTDEVCIRPFTPSKTADKLTRTVALAWRMSFPRHKAIDALSDSVNHCKIPLN
ncbi:MAG: LysR family transcriptional regulator [Sinobacterium sp.]|nr:LysR family transcriptional regulator [Sinobacterium sp.]